MAISKDLFLSILAMDSYNRGYNVGIKTLGGLNSEIGKATIISQSDTATNSEGVNAGFYGLAYDASRVFGFSAGEKAVAYRGTDSLFGTNIIDGDIWNAYGVGAGSPNGKQAELAIKFYQSVAGLGSDLQAANISVTGHSSGGGLAGLVGGLYGKYGALFDNMPFEQAVLVAHDFSLAPSDSEFYNEALKSLVYKTSDPWDVDFSRLLTTYVESEFLVAYRSFQETPQLQLDLDTSIPLNVFTQRHSASLLVILKFANETFGSDGDWAQSIKYLAPALFDSRLGNLIVPTSLIGTSTVDEIVRSAIGYSAIDEGTKVFGDTGIRALFND